MGILNVTPDSFSDGGLFNDDRCGECRTPGGWPPKGAISSTSAAELTRPGALAVRKPRSSRASSLSLSAWRQRGAVLGRYLQGQGRGPRIELGAVLVNDVWGLQKRSRDGRDRRCGEAAVVIMHNRAQKDAAIDIVADIRRFFARSLVLAERRVSPDAHCP